MPLTPEEQAELAALRKSQKDSVWDQAASAYQAYKSLNPVHKIAKGVVDTFVNSGERPVDSPVGPDMKMEPGLQEPVVSPLDLLPVNAGAKIASEAVNAARPANVALAKKITGRTPQIRQLIGDIKSNKILDTTENKLRGAIAKLEDLIGGKSEEAVRSAIAGKQVEVDPAMLKGYVPEKYRQTLLNRRPVEYSTKPGPNYGELFEGPVGQKNLPLENVSVTTTDLPSTRTLFNSRLQQEALPLSVTKKGSAKATTPKQLDLFRKTEPTKTVTKKTVPVNDIPRPVEDFAWQEQYGLPLQTTQITRTPALPNAAEELGEVAYQQGLPIPNVQKKVVDAPVTINADVLLDPKRAADAGNYSKIQTMLDPIAKAQDESRKIAADYMRNKLYEAGGKEALAEQSKQIVAKKFLDRGLKKDPIKLLSSKEGTLNRGLLGRVDEMLGNKDLVNFTDDLAKAQKQTSIFRNTPVNIPTAISRATGRGVTEARYALGKGLEGLYTDPLVDKLASGVGATAGPLSRGSQDLQTPSQPTGLTFLEKLELENLRKLQGN